MISVANVRNNGMPQGIVIYRGPSKIDGKPIVVIATGFKTPSDNPKTGQIIQTWILPANISPLEVRATGKDSSICGDCKHSSIKNGGWNTCYVSVYQAPNNIWRTWKKGRYENPSKMNIHCFRDKIVRIGSYGDPLAVPSNVWKTILSNAAGCSGYTHQWRNCKDDSYKRFCMASCDTFKEKLLAQKMGWRTFRIRREDEEISKDEIVCPASQEGGQITTCKKCGLCSGKKETKDSRKNIAIIIHGRSWKIKRFEKIMSLRKAKKKYTHLLEKSI